MGKFSDTELNGEAESRKVEATFKNIVKNSMKPINFFANKLLAIGLFMLVSVATYGQGRAYIKQQIREEGECRNVAITKTNGDLMLYGKNGCARSGCPQSLNEAITELNNDNQFIDDVQLTENGRWLILYGNNGFRWNDIPYSLEKKIREYNNQNEVITSVTFNDAGDWIVITTNYFSSSDTRINEWLKEGNEKYGQLWAACVTDDAIVAVFQSGYKFFGEVPYSLKEALRNTRLDVFRLKIAGDAWFFADKNGIYEYNM
ncbi:MAG TPA: hypothetical protein PLD56_12395 [Chitinophagales bacterium]|nr:hypothetical protein [Chitinophagales bacterium]HNK07835.1 hypothetical protein [Saprospiraceae bacterium]